MERHGFDQDCLHYSFIKEEGIIIEALTSKVFTLTDQKSSQVISWHKLASGQFLRMQSSSRNSEMQVRSHFFHLWTICTSFSVPSVTILNPFFFFFLQVEADFIQFQGNQFRNFEINHQWFRKSRKKQPAKKCWTLLRKANESLSLIKIFIQICACLLLQFLHARHIDMPNNF